MNIKINPVTLKTVSIAYLFLPFVIFLMGWVKPVFAVLFCGLCVWAFIKAFQQIKKENSDPLIVSRSLLIFVIGLFAVWVALSGIGGFAFQNWDFHWRNALLRDLIQNPWPVQYDLPEISSDRPIQLVYYFGFFLPAAGFGKLFGWQAAQIFLYLWSFVGILLVWLLISTWMGKAKLLTALLLIFFSGADILGFYPYYESEIGFTIRPTFHLENWALHQISSNTTLLFWVFNQTIPCWLTVALLLNTKRIDLWTLLWSLCFFFSPLAAIGLLPFVLLGFLGIQPNFKTPANSRPKPGLSFMKSIKQCFQSPISYAALVVFLISVGFYFTNLSNINGRLLPLTGLRIILITATFFMEGGVIFFLLLWKNRADIYLWVMLVLFALTPFLLTESFNIGMRFVIPTTFLLMLWAARGLEAEMSMTKFFLIILLILGSVTAMFEINRSIYRTWQYYTQDDSVIEEYDGQTELRVFPAPEKAHPGNLLADDLITLQDTEILNNWNYYGDYQKVWLAKMIFKQPVQ